MTTITKFEVDGEISSLTGAFGSANSFNLNDPPGSNVPLWSLGIKPYNHYIIDSLNQINIILPQISQTTAKIGYNVTLINMGIVDLEIRDFNNNFILDLSPKKCVKLIAMDLLQNWIYSSTVLKNSAAPGFNLIENSLATFEYTFKNVISSDASIDIIDNGNQLDFKGIIPDNPAALVLDVYLSTSGSDANDGLTLGTPVLTLTRALEIANKLGWNTQINFNFASGNYVLPDGEPYVFKYTPLGLNSGGYVFKGDAPVLLGSFAVSTTDNTSLAPTQFARINPGALMVPDFYNGRFIFVTSGANTGKYYQISENTATDIFLLTNDTFGVGDTFNVYQNSTSITTQGNRFSDGYLVLSNIDIILEDRLVINPNEIYSWEVIDTFVIFDNVRILTNPAVTNPFILYYGTTIISSDNAYIFADAYSSQNLGLAYDGSNLVNPASDIRSDFINSFVSTSKVYSNRALKNAQNSQMFSFLYYFRNVSTLQIFATNAYLGQVVFKDCDSLNGLLQVGNNSSLGMDSMLQLGTTTVLLRCDGMSSLYINSSFVTLINVIGTVQGLCSMYMNGVTIANMIGTDPNRNFDNSNILFNGCNITSPSQVLTFRCCTCVIFENTNIFGALEFQVYNSSVSLNNFLSQSVGQMIFNNSRIMVGNITLDVSPNPSRITLNQCTLMADTINAAEVPVAGYVINSVNSSVHINNLFIQGPGNNPFWALYFDTSSVYINNFNLNNIATDFAFQATNSVVHITDLNSTTPGGTNFNFALTLSKFYVYNSFSHTGNINGGNYFTLNDASLIKFNNFNYNNCSDLFCNLGSECSVLIDNGGASNIGKFISKTSQSFGLVQFNNVNMNTINTPSNFIELQGGKLVINNCNIDINTIASNYALELYGCNLYMSNTFVNSITAGAIRNNNGGDVNLYDNTFKAGGGSVNNGLLCESSQAFIHKSTFDGYDSGVYLARKSSCILDTVGGTNTSYGVTLLSGSSASQNGSNIVTGGIRDVLLGSVGGQTWANINAGLAADTNDYTTATPQYVFISAF